MRVQPLLVLSVQAYGFLVGITLQISFLHLLHGMMGGTAVNAMKVREGF
jgi:hypothetical protein